MKSFLAALAALTSLAVLTNGQDAPAPETRIEPAVPVPEAKGPETNPPDDMQPDGEDAAGTEVEREVGSPARENPILPVPLPETPEPDPEQDVGQPVSPTPHAAKPPAPPATPPANEGKPLDWEQNIVRVSILDDMRPVTIPVEGEEALGRAAADSKLPRVVSPFPPKALSPIPEGWQLYTDTRVPVRIHRVKFKDGRTLDIGVFPPALMPANPDATTLVLPQSAGNLLGAITSAREAQTESKAKIEALLEAMNRQLPPLDSESTPMP